MPRPTLIYCTLALLVFALLSYTATLTKSATVDEPPHLAAAYAHLRHGDFRLQPDHPPLWKYLAALPWLIGPPVNDHYDNPKIRAALSSIQTQWSWSLITLYRTPGNDPDYLLNSSRLMILLFFSLPLGITIALFAYRLAGPLAACIATTLFCLDPNFLAHSSLVKNDVPITFLFTAVTYLTWRIGQSFTLSRLLLLSLFTAAAVTTKFTGLLAAPIIAILLLTRSLLPTPWPLHLGTRNLQLTTKSSRLFLSFTLCLTCLLTTYFAIWAVYLFRFNPSPDPALHINPADLLLAPSLLTSLLQFSLHHHLLPEAFLDGLLFTFAHVNRITYFLNQITPTGRLAYFPLAFLVKTPLTTLLVLLLSLISPFFARPARSLSSFIIHHSSFSSLLLPFLLFSTIAIASRLNIGIRHIFPLYPLLYIAAAASLSSLYPRYPKLLRPTFALLFLTLSLETLSTYPNYIPFFNIAAGGYKGGYHLLSDSNLDWGQDLPLLADWQQHHPARPLYLAYFGSADPAYYGIQYHNLPYGFALGPPPEPLPSSHATIAVSAMILQHVWPNNTGPDFYAPLRPLHPTQILGGSIYLYDLNGN